jgi:hypothetical protein
MHPETVMDLTPAQLMALLPADVENAMAEEEGERRGRMQTGAAIESLRKKNPDHKGDFSQAEITFEILRLFEGAKHE